MWNAFSLGAESSSGTWIVGAPKGVSESPVVPSRALRLRGRAVPVAGRPGQPEPDRHRNCASRDLGRCLDGSQVESEKTCASANVGGKMS